MLWIKLGTPPCFTNCSMSCPLEEILCEIYHISVTITSHSTVVSIQNLIQSIHAKADKYFLPHWNAKLAVSLCEDFLLTFDRFYCFSFELYRPPTQRPKHEANPTEPIRSRAKYSNKIYRIFR